MKPTCPACQKHSILIYLDVRRIQCADCGSDFPLGDLYKFYRGLEVIQFCESPVSYSADYGLMN